MDSGLSTGDLALMDRNNDWGGNAIIWLFALIALAGGGFNNWGNNGFANAIGYENLATSSEVQRGFDNQNSMANQREILAAVTNGTAQTVAATNQTYHDTVNMLSDKYTELQRDIAGVALAQQQGMASQDRCCCDIKMLIAETSAQNRYDAAMNTQKVLDAISQNKMDALQARVNSLELQAATSNVVRYPNSWTYNAGTSPFCTCNNGCMMNI